MSKAEAVPIARVWEPSSVILKRRLDWQKGERGKGGEVSANKLSSLPLGREVACALGKEANVSPLF